jgi:hypothetical protein
MCVPLALSFRLFSSVDPSKFSLICLRTFHRFHLGQGAPPKFSKDGRVAVIEIQSGYQVHPLIATRWASTLKKSKKTIMVMVHSLFLLLPPTQTPSYPPC